MMHAIYVREVRQGIKNLMLHKLRSFLTMLGMVFGVGSVIAMLAVGEGASVEALERIRRLGSNNIIINSLKPASDESASASRARLSMYGLTYLDFDRIKTRLPDVANAVPVKKLRQEGQLGQRTMQMRLVGTTPDWFKLVKRTRLAGRLILPEDYTESKKVVVLTEVGARKLLATANSIGEHVRIGGVLFQVVGIIRSEEGQGGGMQTPDHPTDAYIPLSVARTHFGDVTYERAAGSRSMEYVELHQIIVQVSETERVEQTAKAIAYMLDHFHDREDYQLDVPLELLRQTEATKRTFNIVLGSIAGISMLVGGIGIMNIMLVSVTERTREIGIRRAIGARRRQIVMQFLIETMVLSTTGGIIGITIGLLIPWIITLVAKMPTVVTPTSVILSIGISMAIGMIFGIYPARRAASLDPIIALRHE